MDWKTEAIDKLKQYEARRESLEIIPKQIADIDATMTSIRSARIDGTPVRGGGNGREDMMLNCIAQKDELRHCLERAGMWVEIVSKGLELLEPDDRLVLDRFYINPEKRAADRLAGDLGIDVKTVSSMLGHSSAGFTLATYTHATNKVQEQAAAKMGSLLKQAL